MTQEDVLAHVFSLQLTAFGNGIWYGASAALVALGLYLIVCRRDVVKGLAFWYIAGDIVKDTAEAAHRLYWNIGIWTRPACEVGMERCSNYSSWILQHKHWLLLAIALIAVGR